jgi:hypothetical protein
VWAVGHPALSFEGRVLAAVLAVGPGAVASARSAAQLWRVDPIGARTVEVLAPHRHRPLDAALVHSTRFLPEIDRRRIGAVPVTSPTRTLVELADVIDLMRLVRAMHEFRFRRLLSIPELRRAERRHRHRRGHPVLVQAIRLHLDGSQGSNSSNEIRFLRMLLARGIPEPLMNVLVFANGGKHVVDFVWMDRKLCVELDDGSHDLPAARRRDPVRNRDLKIAGYDLLRVPTDHMDHGADRIADLFELR